MHKALESSLRNLGYLADDRSSAVYILSADIIELDRPAVAFDPALLVVSIDLSVTARIH